MDTTNEVEEVQPIAFTSDLSIMKPLAVLDAEVKMVRVTDPSKDGVELFKPAIYLKFKVQMREGGRDKQQGIYPASIARVIKYANSKNDKDWHNIIMDYIGKHDGIDNLLRKLQTANTDKDCTTKKYGVVDYNKVMPLEEDQTETHKDEDVVEVTEVKQSKPVTEKNPKAPKEATKSNGNGKVKTLEDKVEDAVEQATVIMPSKRKGDESLEETKPPAKKSKAEAKTTEVESTEEPARVPDSTQSRKRKVDKPEHTHAKVDQHEEVRAKKVKTPTPVESQEAPEAVSHTNGKEEAEEEEQQQQVKKPPTKVARKAPTKVVKKTSKPAAPPVNIVQLMADLDVKDTPFSKVSTMRPSVSAAKTPEEKQKAQKRIDEIITSAYDKFEVIRKNSKIKVDIDSLQDINNLDMKKDWTDPPMYVDVSDVDTKAAYALMGLTNGYINENDVIELVSIPTAPTPAQWNLTPKLMKPTSNKINFAVFLIGMGPEGVFDKTKSGEEREEGDYGIPVTADISDLIATFVAFENQAPGCKLDNMRDILYRSRVKRTGIPLWALIHSITKAGKEYIETTLAKYRSSEVGYLDNEIAHTLKAIEGNNIAKKAVAVQKPTPSHTTNKSASEQPEASAKPKESEAEQTHEEPLKLDKVLQTDKPHQQAASKVVEKPQQIQEKEKPQPKPQPSPKKSQPPAQKPQASPQKSKSTLADLRIVQHEVEPKVTEVEGEYEEKEGNGLSPNREQASEIRDRISDDMAVAKGIRSEMVTCLRTIYPETLINEKSPMGDIKRQFNKLAQDRQKDMNMISEKLEKMQAMKEELTKNGNKICSQEAEITELRDKVATLEVEKRFLSDQLQQLTSTKIRLEKEVVSLSESLEVFQSESASKQDLEDANEKNEELVKELDELTSQLADAESKTQRYKQENDKIVATDNALKSELKTQQQHCQTLNDKVSALTAENGSLRTLMQRISEGKDDLFTMAEGLRQSAESMQAIASLLKHNLD